MRQLSRAEITGLRPTLLTQAVIGRLDGGEVGGMAIDHNAHAELGQTLVVTQFRIAVGHQHQRHAQGGGYLLQMGKILYTDNADGIGTGRLIGLGALYHLLNAKHAGMGSRDDGQVRVDPRLQRSTDLADTFGHADQVRGLAPKLRRQQGVFDGQRSNPRALQLNHGTHHVECIAIAVVGIGDHRQAADSANTGSLLDKLAEGDQGKVRRGQNL